MSKSSVQIFPLTLVRVGGLPFEVLEKLGSPHWQAILETQKQIEKVAREARQALVAALDSALQNLPDGPARTAVYKARQRFFYGKWPDFERLSPEIQSLAQAAKVAEAESKNHLQNLENQWKTALAENYAWLQRHSAEDDFQRSLLFASHDLLARLPDFRAAQPADFSKTARQTALSVYQYLARAGAKTSPFSRFTTVAMHRLNQDFAVDEDAPVQFAKASVAPNVALLEALYNLLLPHDFFYKSLIVKLNPFVVAPKDVYEFLYFDGTEESIQRLTSDAAVDFVVEKLLASERYLPFKTLLEQLGTAIEAPPELLERFLLDLTELGLLEWDWPEKGFSPGWCGGLYNFLGHLPAEALIVETASLLQWLRTAARTLPFQSPDVARQTILETARLLRTHFEKFGAAAPPIPPEQLFFEDVESPVFGHLNAEEMRDLLENLPKSLKNWQAEHFSKKEIAAVSSSRPAGFSTFDFFRERQKMGENAPEIRAEWPIDFEPTGLLAQFFRADDGQTWAVLNARYAGGGKLMARWLHLFSPETTERLRAWNDFSVLYLPRKYLATWSALGWHNANFHPPLCSREVDFPGGRTRTRGWNALLAGELRLVQNPHFYLNRFGGNWLDDQVYLADVGLESWATRTPMARLFLRAGVPESGLSTWLARLGGWREAAPGIASRPRSGAGRWIFSRAVWRVQSAAWQAWADWRGFDFFLKINDLRMELAWPRFAFYRFPDKNEKPQYLDFQSPVSVLLFEKMLRQGRGPLELTEMLPAPGQLVLGNKGRRVGEFVFEIRG